MYRYIHAVLYATVLRVGTYSEDNIDCAGVKVPFLSFQKMHRGLASTTTISFIICQDTRPFWI